MAFEGDLSHLALGDVLQTLAMSRQTGTFVVRGDVEERRLVFGARGMGLLTVRPSLRARLVAHLVGKGRLDAGEAEAALAAAPQTGHRGIEAMLVSEGRVDEAQLAESRRYVAGEEIFDLFLWSSGTFEFISEDPSDLTPYGNVWFDVASVAMEAARRMDEVAQLRGTLPATEVLIRLVDEDPDPARFGADAAKLLALADGTRTVDGILDASHLGRFDTWKVLDALREAEYLRAASPGEMAAAADWLLGQADHRRASAVLRRLLELDPANDAARQNLVVSLAAAGERKGAAAEWIQVARRAEDLGDSSAAVDAYRQAARLDSANAAAADGLARSLLASGDREAAAEAARTASSLHLECGDHAAAIAVVDLTMRSCPRDPHLRIALANAHLAAGAPADAVAMLDDAASLLEAARGDPRLRLDVYRRILQLDPGRKDCARRIEDVESRESSRRKKLARRVAVVAGIVLAALAAIPVFSGPSFGRKLDDARLAVAEHRWDDAQAAIDVLEATETEPERLDEVRAVRELLVRSMPKTATELALTRLTDSLERIQHAAAEAQTRSWSESFLRYGEGLDVLGGADAKLVEVTQLHSVAALRRGFLDDLNASLQAFAIEASAASARVAGARERLTEDVFRREDPAALRDIVERAEDVMRIRASQDWGAAAEVVAALGRKLERVKDDVDKRIVQAIQPMIEGFPFVEEGGARALAAVRKLELLERYPETHGRGLELLAEGRIEAAEEVYRSFLALCDELRKAEPRKLYDPILAHFVDGMNLEAPQRERLRQIEAIRGAETAADAALARDDVAEAFRIRVGLVREHRSVDFRPRFRLPVRIESRPVGATVTVVGEEAGDRVLGTTPVARFEHAVDMPARLVVHLDGFEDVTVERRGAMEDEGGIVSVELPKKHEFAVTGIGSVQSAVVQSGDRMVFAGRDGRVRLHSVGDGAECAKPFETRSLAGVAGAPAVFRDRVFVATLDGTGFVLDAGTLEKLAEVRFDGPVRAGLVATPAGVAAVTEAGTAELIDAAGGVVWTCPVGKVVSDPALAGTRLLFLNTDGELVAIDAATGAPAGRVRLPEELRWTGVVASGDRAWVGGDGGLIACVDVPRGEIDWMGSVDGAVRSRPCLGEGRLLVATSSGSLHSIEPATGRETGRADLGAPARHSPLALPDGSVAVTEKGVVLRFDASGALLWRYDARDQISSDAALVGGRIVLATRKGTLVSLRP